MFGLQSSLDVRIKTAAKIISNANHLVVITGAGISTESGLPDFRGDNGLWTRAEKGLPPLQDKVEWDKVNPNKGHFAIVELQNLKLLKFIITQNLDNLHRKSGIKEELLAEIHGNTTLMRCLSCEKRFEKKGLWDDNIWGPGYFGADPVEDQPKCSKCGGRIVSTIINFGDDLLDDEWNSSELHCEMADVLLIVGTSLSVEPASDLPELAVKNNAKIIIINNKPTHFDQYASVLFKENSGDVLVSLIEKIKDIVFIDYN